MKEYSGYDWGYISGPDGKRTLTCFPSDTERCIVIHEPHDPEEAEPGGFYSPPGNPDFHDHGLREATAEINKILASVRHPSGKVGLHLLITESGPMLAWDHSEVMIASVDGS